MPEYTVAEARDWAREKLRGAINCTIPAENSYLVNQGIHYNYMFHSDFSATHQEDLKARVVGAMVYPIFLLSMGLAVGAVLVPSAVRPPSRDGTHRVAAAMDLGEPATALEHAERTDPQLPAGFEEREARYLIDCARAYVAHRRDDDALHALLDAEEAAPEEVQAHPLTTSVVVELLGRERRTRTPGLRGLASRSGALEIA